MTAVDIMKLKRNDVEGALAFWRAGRHQSWWAPEMMSMLLRLFDRPEDLSARIRVESGG